MSAILVTLSLWHTILGGCDRWPSSFFIKCNRIVILKSESDCTPCIASSSINRFNQLASWSYDLLSMVARSVKRILMNTASRNTIPALISHFLEVCSFPLTMLKFFEVLLHPIFALFITSFIHTSTISVFAIPSVQCIQYLSQNNLLQWIRSEKKR